ncbi:hypothetical protein ColLi_07643 [Colletotrichum liriopes]|uniref:Uncharacterized protein n=1 Tax=Colletotrichum liriopes TaxID=708192 RepID=A0AA37LTI1_9PEZI|nr:hypothetical protein ColLi_07643 [Colletotrichum liriopes]
MLYSKILIAAITGISCVAAIPAEAAKKEVEAFRRGECRDSRDDLYCGRSVKEFTKYDAKNRLCYNDGSNRLFCAIREQQELAIELARENRGNYVFCADRERGAAREKARDHFEDRRNRDKKQA